MTPMTGPIDMTDVDKDKIPLKLKLKAWWEGYDAKELEERYRATLAEGEAEGEAEASPAEEPEPLLTPHEFTSPDEDDDWNDARAAVTQLIWGEGYCGPGGSDQIISMTQLLALDPKMSMVVIGASLGGPSRALADNFGVWITGMERSARLVDEGNHISKTKGMSKKVVLEQFDPENVEKFKRNYDRVFAKESFFTIENKSALLSTLFEGTKSEGLFLLTDYVLGSESVVVKDEFKEWRDHEPVRPYCVLPDELEGMVNSAGYSVRVSEDISQQYIKLIADAWQAAGDVVAQLMKSDDTKHLIDALLKEAEFWARRSKMLQTGDLKLWRILGYKKASGSKMMSDW